MDFPESETIHRDVCIVGGGASGTYAAIRLRDEGKSLMVVESEHRLGGHTTTFTDPLSNKKTEYGVVIWHDLPIVRKYFDRLNSPLRKVTNFNKMQQNPQFVDFRSGKSVEGYSPGNMAKGLAAWAAQLSKYPYLESGFDLPDPIPEDLLLPFGEYAKKYDLHDGLFIIFEFNQGYGDFMKQPTLYVMKVFGLDCLRNLSGSFLEDATDNNSQIYAKAQEVLKDDILLNSRVIATDRVASDSVKVVVQTPSGQRLVRAKKLVLAIPQKLDNLIGFDLDDEERSLFGQFTHSAYYTGLVRNTGIPPKGVFYNVGNNTPGNIAALPGLYSITPSKIEGIFDFKYGSPVPLSDAQVKADVLASIARLQEAHGFPKDKPDIIVYANHTPYAMSVPAEAVRGGFYRRLNALQGRRNTFYTGAAFQTHDSSLIWQFTEALIPKIFQ